MAKRNAHKDEPLNLVPIMNLVTILIPALLIAVKAVTLTMIETKLPAIGPPIQSTEVAENKDPPLALKLVISSKGITVDKKSLEFAFGGDVPEEYKSESPKQLLPCKGGNCFEKCDEKQRQTDLNCYNYNFPELTKKLAEIKKRAIDENRFEKTSANLVLLPDKSIPYIVLVHVMDAARGKAKDDTGNSVADEFEKYAEKEPHKAGLFSAISFAGGTN